MIIVVLVKKKSIYLRLKLLKKKKYQIDDFAKKWSTSTTFNILEETNNFS